MNRQWKTHHMLWGSTEIAVEETADKSGIYLEIHEDAEHSARVFLDYSDLWDIRMLLGAIDVRPIDKKEKPSAWRAISPDLSPSNGVSTTVAPSELAQTHEEGRPGGVA